MIEQYLNYICAKLQTLTQSIKEDTSDFGLAFWHLGSFWATFE